MGKISESSYFLSRLFCHPFCTMICKKVLNAFTVGFLWVLASLRIRDIEGVTMHLKYDLFYARVCSQRPYSPMQNKLEINLLKKAIDGTTAQHKKIGCHFSLAAS